MGAYAERLGPYEGRLGPYAETHRSVYRLAAQVKTTITSVWMTFDMYVHAQRQLVCTANISTIHEWSLIKF